MECKKKERVLECCKPKQQEKIMQVWITYKIITVYPPWLFDISVKKQIDWLIIPNSHYIISLNICETKASLLPPHDMNKFLYLVEVYC